MPNQLQQQEPFRAFRFLVEMEGYKRVVAAFSQFSGIKMQTQAVPARVGADPLGVLEMIPTITTFQPVTLTKGVIGDNQFFNWILSCAPNAMTPPTGSQRYRTINIVALDSAGKPGITWSLLNALPVSYELSPMDSSQNAVMTETIEIAFASFQRKASQPGYLKQEGG